MSDSPPNNPSKNGAPRRRVPLGAGGGALGGLVIALLIARKLPPLGYYGGDQVVIFALCIGLGAAIGAGIARLRNRAGRAP